VSPDLCGITAPPILTAPGPAPDWCWGTATHIAWNSYGAKYIVQLIARAIVASFNGDTRSATALGLSDLVTRASSGSHVYVAIVDGVLEPGRCRNLTVARSEDAAVSDAYDSRTSDFLFRIEAQGLVVGHTNGKLDAGVLFEYHSDLIEGRPPYNSPNYGEHGLLCVTSTPDNKLTIYRKVLTVSESRMLPTDVARSEGDSTDPISPRTTLRSDDF
jgi:hypothetical protein